MANLKGTGALTLAVPLNISLGSAGQIVGEYHRGSQPYDPLTFNYQAFIYTRQTKPPDIKQGITQMQQSY